VDLGNKKPLEFEVIRTTYTANAGAIINRQDTIGFKAIDYSDGDKTMYLTTKLNETGSCVPCLATSTEGSTTEPGWSLNIVNE
jgi:hypothetical protein